jgi:hypothetical protein
VEHPVSPHPAGSLAAALLQLAELAERVEGLDRTVEALGAQLAADPPGEAYEPVPTVQWWRLDASERAEELKRLESWTRAVYIPGYGHLAAALPSCWAEHDLCLYILDWLIELWSVLYVATDEERTKGTLAGQAEFQTRILPAAVQQMEREGTGCKHARAAANGHPRPAPRVGGAR